MAVCSQTVSSFLKCAAVVAVGVAAVFAAGGVLTHCLQGFDASALTPIGVGAS